MFENPEETAFETSAEPECAVCGAAHDEEIHQATLSIHRWFHHQVTHDFKDDPLYMPSLSPSQAPN